MPEHFRGQFLTMGRFTYLSTFTFLLLIAGSVLLRIHHGQITANQVLLPVLEELEPVAEARASHLMVCICW